MLVNTSPGDFWATALCTPVENNKGASNMFVLWRINNKMSEQNTKSYHLFYFFDDFALFLWLLVTSYSL